jgi:hypothetical protein
MTTRPILLAASLLALATSVATAQSVATYDPQQLPATKGQVAQYSLTPRGDVDGVILDDGTQVHMPPHLGAQLVHAIKPGDAVTVRGLKAQALPLIQALSISGASGQTIVDTGPPVTPPSPIEMTYRWLTVQGRVHEPLYGPRGDLNGALLDDGTQIHLPPDQAGALESELQPGKSIAAQGYGVTDAYGRALDAQQIGESAARLVNVGPLGPRGPLGPPPQAICAAPPLPPPAVAPPPPVQNQ